MKREEITMTEEEIYKMLDRFEKRQEIAYERNAENLYMNKKSFSRRDYALMHAGSMQTIENLRSFVKRAFTLESKKESD